MRQRISKVVYAFAPLFVIVFAASVYGQQPAAPPPAPTSPSAKVATQEPAVPTVSDEDQRTFGLLGFKAQVQNEMVVAAQKEVDSTNAEIGRFVAKLAREGYSLARDPQSGRLTYVKTEKK
jgi:hypothetical protein